MSKKTNLINLFSSVAALTLAIVAILGLSVGYLYLSRQNTAAPSANTNQISNTQAANTQAPAKPADEEIPFFSPGPRNGDSPSNIHFGMNIIETVLRLLLAVVLSGILAFRPRKNIPLFRRNLYVAQTQILLAVVAAALMLIVGDNTARAFAIFAAVSLVRFRTNIRDPKEITVLLISLSLGLATGVGRWDLGIVLCLFALVLLWILEYREPEQVYRSMELTIKTRDTDKTQDMLKKIFAGNDLEAEIRQIDPPDEKDPVGCIMYYLNLPLNVSTDTLSDLISSTDAENIEGIEWKHQKNATYIYQ